MLERLSFEDEQIALQVLGATWPALTPRQKDCLLLYLLLGDQGQVALVLGIDQSVVSRHWSAALEKIGRVSGEYA